MSLGFCKQTPKLGLRGVGPADTPVEIVQRSGSHTSRGMWWIYAGEANHVHSTPPRSLLNGVSSNGIQMRDFLVVTLKRVTAALIAAALYDVISRNLYSETPPFAFLTQPIPRFAVIFAAAFIVLSGVIRYFRKRREDLVSDNAPPGFVVNGRPNNVEEAVSVEKWGVIWRGIYGRNSRRSKPYIHVEGPFCPHDDTELARRKITKWIFFTRRAWVCPRCDREYKRPIRHLHNESDEVGKIMKSDIEHDRVIEAEDA